MLCSVGKSDSNWLDRLRSSKGFPAAGDLSLDHFLNNDDPNPSNSTIIVSLTSNAEPKSNYGSPRSDENSVRLVNQLAESSTGDEDKEWFGVMTNVLSELFNMGDSCENSTFSRKKSSRKQTNPKICVLPNSSESIESQNVERRESVAAATPVTRNDFNLTENKVSSDGDLKMKKEANGDCLDGENEKCNGGDLLRLGYSRSEVTIIDTSCASWKFDKLLFRKKNVWKVRDKKGRSRNVGWKKRKAIPGDEDVGGKKIAKLLMISPFDDEGADCVVPLNESQNPQNDKTFQEMPNILGQVPEKRFQFPRSARKTSKGGTSGIHKNVAR